MRRRPARERAMAAAATLYSDTSARPSRRGLLRYARAGPDPRSPGSPREASDGPTETAEGTRGRRLRARDLGAPAPEDPGPRAPPVELGQRVHDPGVCEARGRAMGRLHVAGGVLAGSRRRSLSLGDVGGAAPVQLERRSAR